MSDKTKEETKEENVVQYHYRKAIEYTIGAESYLENGQHKKAELCIGIAGLHQQFVDFKIKFDVIIRSATQNGEEK